MADLPRANDNSNQGLFEDETNGSDWKTFYYKNNRKCFCLLILVIFAISVPTLIFVFVYSHDAADLTHTCNILPNYRIPCGPPGEVTAQQCDDINCCYYEKIKRCYQQLPSRYQYKSTDEDWRNGFIPMLENSPFGTPNAERLYLSYKNDSNEVLLTLDTENISKRNILIENDNYKLDITTKEMGVEIRRNDDSKDLILTTTHGPTIVSDKYWEWTLNLNTDNLYGLDQFYFKENQTITRVIYPNNKNHGVLPKFMAEVNGKFHGVYIDHNGPIEITVLPSKLIILRMFSGEKVTIHLNLGPKPSDIWQQQHENGVLPPYWTLGVHLCRDSALDDVPTYLEELSDLLTKLENEKVPYESHCLHEKLFSLSYKQTSDTVKIKSIINKLKTTNGKRFIMSMPPHIHYMDNEAYNDAKQKDILYKKSDGTEFISRYNKDQVVFPDYSSKEAKEMVQTALKKLIESVGEPDGFVLRDNWPKSDDEKFKNKSVFPYLSEELEEAMSNTIPWDAISSKTTSSHFVNHNNYGLNQLTAISTAKPNVQFLMTPTQNLNSKHPSHIQNVDLTWVEFKQMISSTLSTSLFGNPLNSIPICGSTLLDQKVMTENQEKVCVKWYQASLSMPMARISSDDPSRDPVSVTSKFLSKIAKEAIRERYRLLPFYYSVLKSGSLLVQPMVFDFYKDNNTFPLDEQYMVGKEILVAHSIYPDAAELNVYLPEVDGGWFEYWGGKKYAQQGWNKIFTVESDIVMFLRAGSIIPINYNIDCEKCTTAEKIRENVPITLIIVPSKYGYATGKMTFNDKTDVIFKYDQDASKISLDLNQLYVDPICTQSPKTVNTKVEAIRLYICNEIKTLPLVPSVQELCGAGSKDILIDIPTCT